MGWVAISNRTLALKCSQQSYVLQEHAGSCHRLVVSEIETVWELLQALVVDLDSPREETHGLNSVSSSPFPSGLFEVDASWWDVSGVLPDYGNYGPA